MEKKISHILHKRYDLPDKDEVRSVVRSFSPIQKGVFFLLVFMLAGSTIGIFAQLNSMFLVEIPTRGGSISEGVIGLPRFINPLLAKSDAERDITMLVYSGLLRYTPEGNLIPDLAKNYTISDDGLIYTFTLKDNILWHDGVPISAEDVVFTIHKAQERAIDSPRRASWEGVNVRAVDTRTVEFTLQQPYSPFLDNTTMGILPKHIWQNIDAEAFRFSNFNIEPIGSGPYKVDNIKHDSNGLPEYYDLVSFEDFALGEPYIPTIQIRFYTSEEKLLDAYEKQKIEHINTVAPENAKQLQIEGARIERAPLPRVLGMFFNQDEAPIFAEKAVREALRVGFDKDRIIDEVLFGYGTAIDHPIPPGSVGYIHTTEDKPREDMNDETSSSTVALSYTEKARQILLDAGWKPNEDTGIMEKTINKNLTPLSFSISTSDVPEFKAAAAIIKEEWSKIGASVDLKIFESGDLTENVIVPRKYDILFFGEIVGKNSDPFAFWHSSQRNHPGLNIARYTNIAVDRLLEEARATQSTEKRIKMFEEFQKEIAADIPAVFIYAPDFLYVVSPKLHGVNVGPVATPAERFLDVHHWYVETEKVWKFFTN